MNGLEARFDSAQVAKQKDKACPFHQIHAELAEIWYTSSALNTSVVLCGPSGAVLDLRLPPPVSSVRLSRNLKQGWQSKPPARPRVRVRTATASASKKVILNVECFRSECRALLAASGGKRLSAIFRNVDLSLCEGEIGRGAIYDADSGTGCGNPASAGRQRCAGNGAAG